MSRIKITIDERRDLELQLRIVQDELKRRGYRPTNYWRELESRKTDPTYLQLTQRRDDLKRKLREVTAPKQCLP